MTTVQFELPAGYMAASADAGLSLSQGNFTYVVVVAVIALLAMGVAVRMGFGVLAAGQGTAKMQDIAAGIQEGAVAYLRRQFKTLGIFVILAIPLLVVLPVPDNDLSLKVGRSLFFVLGAVFSGVIGYVGMWLATRVNVRVAAAARDGHGPIAMRLAFRTGGVVGFLTVGLGLLGAASVVLFYEGNAPTVLEGFGFGAALLAMFMRVGGGIFTKAADVGADLVGKVEKNIPEDDPRNAATIADNVGDNVGDCAGMAADLFESYAVTLVAALILGRAAFGEEGLIFPLVVPAVGAVCAVVAVALTRMRPSDTSGMAPINRAFFASALLAALLSTAAAFLYLPSTFAELSGVAESLHNHSSDPRVVASLAVLIGIVLAGAIQLLTGYFTGTGRRPVNDVTKTALTGPATVILSGFTVGLESAVYTALAIGAAVLGAFLLGGGSIVVALFAVALAGCGLLTTVGVIVAMDTFGPISDNAQGIAEMSGDVGGDGARVLAELDAAGNTTKAITKGIAISTAVLAATALFGSFTNAVRSALAEAGGIAVVSMREADDALSFEGVVNVANPKNLVGLLVGAAVVFLFSALAINAVTRAASSVVFEVRRQFKEIPGIMDGSGKPEYGRVVDICTRDSLRELATPGLLAVLAPVAVGFGLGVGALGAYLAGAIVTGTLMAVFLANSGGAWDNSKKTVEDGVYGGKGSSAHAATVIGDTVGDPFKDTAGPAINPLLKVMNLVSLLVAPAVVALSVGTDANSGVRVAISATAIVVIVVAVWTAKQRPITVGS